MIKAPDGTASHDALWNGVVQYQGLGRLAKCLSPLAPVLRGLLLIAAIIPLAVTRLTVQPAWDELFFLHRAACIDRELFNGSVVGVDRCLAGMAKSPILGLLLVPLGPLDGQIDRLAAAPFMLAIVTFTLALWLAWICQRARLPLLGFAGAAIAIGVCGPLSAAGAPLLVDAPFSLLVAALLLVPALECAEPTPAPGRAWQRGLLWGAIVTMGSLGKLTFGIFGLLIAPVMLFVSWRHSGARATVLKCVSAAVVCLLVLLMFVRYGHSYLAHARESAFGELSTFYDDHLSRWTFLYDATQQAGLIYWLIGAALLVIALLHRRRDFGRLGVALVGIGIALAYLLVASGSPNKDPRFFWPVWLALPLLVASALPQSAQPKSTASGGFPLAPAFACMLVLSLPMTGHFDVRNVRLADEVLRTLPRDRPATVMIASDEAHFNIETLILAREVDYGALRQLTLGTVIYDIVNGRTPDQSDQALRTADYVLIRTPLPLDEPEWTNRYGPRFLATAERCGRVGTPAAGTAGDAAVCDAARRL